MKTEYSKFSTGAKLPVALEAKLVAAHEATRIPKSYFLQRGLEIVLEEFERTGKISSASEARAAAIEEARPSKKPSRKSG